jgi:hypothetical protein
VANLDQVATDPRAEFLSMKGFSRSNRAMPDHGHAKFSRGHPPAFC